MARPSSRLLNLGARSPLASLWTRAHAALYRRTGGRVLGRWFGGPVLVLEVVGRKSGRVRRTPLVRVEDGENLVVIPANAGSDKMPAWWLNLRDAGEGWAIRGRRRDRVRPRVTEGAERERLLRLFVSVYPAMEDYAAFTNRDWPVVVLEPADG